MRDDAQVLVRRRNPVEPVEESFLHTALVMVRSHLGGSSCGVGEWLPVSPPRESTQPGDPRILFVARRVRLGGTRPSRSAGSSRAPPAYGGSGAGGPSSHGSLRLSLSGLAEHLEPEEPEKPEELELEVDPSSWLNLTTKALHSLKLYCSGCLSPSL